MDANPLLNWQLQPNNHRALLPAIQFNQLLALVFNMRKFDVPYDIANDVRSVGRRCWFIQLAVNIKITRKQTRAVVL